MSTKRANLLDEVRRLVADGDVRYTVHGFEREAGRGITQPEANHVLMTGWHEKKKDQYDPAYEDTHPWAYAIRGKTLDDRPLRIVVTFEEDDSGELLLVVTLIDLSLKEDS